MIEPIKRILQEECLLAQNQPVLAGISGGPDSLCLLNVLVESGYSVIVAHLDHAMRAESGAEALKVKEIALQMGLPYCMERVDVLANSKERHLSIEESAREVRYRFLFKQAEIYSAQAVATGHNADDQVETVLMHLLRGSGLAGLRGIQYRSLPNPWSLSIPLVRPLLSSWRREIVSYLESHNLNPSLDPTNMDVRFYRNRLRHELLPLLETYNPGLRQRLWQMAYMIQQDYAIIELQIDQAWESCVVEEDNAYIAFDLERIRQQLPAIQRHILRRAFGRLRPSMRDIDFLALEHSQQFISTPSRSGQTDWIAGLRLRIHTRRLWLTGWETELPNEQLQDFPSINSVMPIPIPGEIRLDHGWMLLVNRISDISAALNKANKNMDPFQAWFDLGFTPTELTLRPRRQGDRFQPLGMNGQSIKLSDYMINIRLPIQARANWPLVIANGQIAWLPGLRSSHAFRLIDGSQNVIHFRLSRDHAKETEPGAF